MYPVVIIDDEETTREGLKKHVNWGKYGFYVAATAKNGFEAIKIIEEHKPVLALCDIKMAQMDGIELGQIVSKKYSYCRIIYLSGYTNQNHLREALRLRALDFFDKPLDINAFHDRLSFLSNELSSQHQENANYTQRNRQLLTQELLFEILKTNSPNTNKIIDLAKSLKLDLSLSCPSFIVMSPNNPKLHTQLINFMLESNNNGLHVTSVFNQICFTLIQNIDHKVFYNFPVQDQDHFLLIGSVYQNILEIRNEIPYMQRVFDLLLDRGQQNVVYIEDINEANVVIEVKKIMNDLYAENLSIKEISEYVYLSPQYLCNLYKKETGKTINDELTDIRLEHAKKLLSDNSYKIYEVAKLVGYNDSSYFSRLFKKKFNLSPSEFRDKL